MKKKLLILSDYGLDDAAATAYLIKEREHFEKIDIIAVGGNVSTEVSFTNAKKLLTAIYDEDNSAIERVRLFDSSCIKQSHCVLPSIHGKDGMGDLFTKEDGKINIVPYSQIIKEIDESYVVLSLGPLTITKQIFDNLNKKCELVIMAGIVDEVPNFEGVEFNQALDIPAYKHCVKNFQHVIATLDTCRNEKFNMADKYLSGKTVLERVANRAIELAMLRHPDNSYIYDLMAALYLIHPQIFEVEAVSDNRGSILTQLKVKNNAKHLKEYL